MAVTAHTMLAVNQAKASRADVAHGHRARLRLRRGRGILKELPLERWHLGLAGRPGRTPPANDCCLGGDRGQAALRVARPPSKTSCISATA